ncbi:unnamed protein product [Trichogramma brassicae]|uniref:Uncharacterized protein n=1 Tax=Trichogramma brassicae TaxID=86971 RepID=A0A6H5J3X1_9HYME|nr:unnamed protein product [Trichogramma brassicae]
MKLTSAPNSEAQGQRSRPEDSQRTEKTFQKCRHWPWLSLSITALPRSEMQGPLMEAGAKSLLRLFLIYLKSRAPQLKCGAAPPGGRVGSLKSQKMYGGHIGARQFSLASSQPLIASALSGYRSLYVFRIGNIRIAPFLSSNSITRSSLRNEAKFGGSVHSTIVFEILMQPSSHFFRQKTCRAVDSSFCWPDSDRSRFSAAIRLPFRARVHSQCSGVQPSRPEHRPTNGRLNVTRREACSKDNAAIAKVSHLSKVRVVVVSRVGNRCVGCAQLHKRSREKEKYKNMKLSIDLHNKQILLQKDHTDVSLEDKAEIENQIAQLLKHNLIEESYRPFAAPVTLAYKRDEDGTTWIRQSSRRHTDERGNMRSVIIKTISASTNIDCRFCFILIGIVPADSRRTDRRRRDARGRQGPWIRADRSRCRSATTTDRNERERDIRFTCARDCANLGSASRRITRTSSELQVQYSNYAGPDFERHAQVEIDDYCLARCKSRREFEPDTKNIAVGNAAGLDIQRRHAPSVRETKTGVSRRGRYDSDTDNRTSLIASDEQKREAHHQAESLSTNIVIGRKRNCSQAWTKISEARAKFQRLARLQRISSLIGESGELVEKAKSLQATYDNLKPCYGRSSTAESDEHNSATVTSSPCYKCPIDNGTGSKYFDERTSAATDVTSGELSATSNKTDGKLATKAKVRDIENPHVSHLDEHRLK